MCEKLFYSFLILEIRFLKKIGFLEHFMISKIRRFAEREDSFTDWQKQSFRVKEIRFVQKIGFLNGRTFHTPSKAEALGTNITVIFANSQ